MLNQVWFAASDLGWVVGHSYIVYAPLLHRNTTILYEVSVESLIVIKIQYNLNYCKLVCL